MQKPLSQDIKDFFVSGNMVNKLIVTNLIVSLLALAVHILSGGGMYGHLGYFLLSSDIGWDLKHAWVFVTNMFVSGRIIHFIFNMLFLYWFGSIIGEMIGDKKILPLYILSGIAGMILFLVLYPFFYYGTSMVSGVDAIVIAFAIASAVLVPRYSVNLILIGRVPLKIVAGVYVALEFLYALSSHNPAILYYAGSALMGWFYIYSIRRGRGLDKMFYAVTGIFKGFAPRNSTRGKRNLRLEYKNRPNTKKSKSSDKEFQKRLDEILDKIKKVGYDNLTDEEKEFLFIAGKR